MLKWVRIIFPELIPYFLSFILQNFLIFKRKGRSKRRLFLPNIVGLLKAQWHMIDSFSTQTEIENKFSMLPHYFVSIKIIIGIFLRFNMDNNSYLNQLLIKYIVNKDRFKQIKLFWIFYFIFRIIMLSY